MSERLAQRFEAHGEEWRDPHGVVAQWAGACDADDALLRATARGGWWDALDEAGVALIVSREYEHLLLAISPRAKRRLSYLRLPHPSGIAFDAARRVLHVASTRNPNQLYSFVRASAAHDRRDTGRGAALRHVLVPAHTRYLPGSYYLHDLALVGGELHGNAVGRNAVVALGGDQPADVWWPAALERDGRPLCDRNYVQLNSIAAGADLASSFFSASGERPGRYRPGDAAYPVDGRGVIFSGATREPVARGLTRPHSARLRAGTLWVDNSGYGEVGVVRDGRFETVARLPGWTRGLAFGGPHGSPGAIAFVGTSRVIPRFRQYAPGLDLDRSRCAIHAVDAASGRVRGSLEFPHGNQIFAVEPVPAGWTEGFPFARGVGAGAVRRLFYAYDPG